MNLERNVLILKKDRVKKSIEWKEIKKHNRHDDCWTVIHGKVYDVTKWAPKHPGGDIVLLGGGNDSTIQFESYHLKEITEKILNKYLIGEVKNEQKNNINKQSFYDWEKNDFYNTLKTRVNLFFDEHNNTLSHRDVPEMYIKTFAIMYLWFMSWYYTVIKGSYIGAIFLGISCSLIGTCLMHDANHGAYSKSTWINKIGGWGMDFIGSCGFVWEFQHVNGHHAYTNLMIDNPLHIENDPDVFSSYPFIRMHPTNKLKWYHKYQHIYCFFVFAFFTMLKVFKDDYDCIFGGHVFKIDMTPRLSSKLNMCRFYASKIFSVGYMLILLIKLLEQ